MDAWNQAGDDAGKYSQDDSNQNCAKHDNFVYFCLISMLLGKLNYFRKG